jgi:hypothetical protein
MGGNGIGKTLAGGLVVIGLVAAFGLHASGLAQVGQTGFTGFNKVLGTAEKG